MFSSLKLSHHKHTGKLKEHKSTSFLPLFILVIAVSSPLSIATASAQSWTRPDPDAESISLTGVVEGKPPTEAARITSPTDLTRTSQSPIEISGTCPVDTIVQIYKNDMFAGSTVCRENGTFKLEIDLLIGENILIARVFDALNQEGPDSNSVIVNYDAVAAQSPALGALNFGSSQMILVTDAVFRGIFPDQLLTVPLNIIGGRAPYAVNIFWGDSTNNVIARNDSSAFDVTHKYTRAGIYQLNIQATDADGRVAFLSVAVIVNGATSVGITTDARSSSNLMLVIYTLWPAYLAVLGVVGGFFLGEVREKRVLKRRGLLFNPPTPLRPIKHSK